MFFSLPDNDGFFVRSDLPRILSEEPKGCGLALVRIVANVLLKEELSEAEAKAATKFSGSGTSVRALREFGDSRGLEVDVVEYGFDSVIDWSQVSEALTQGVLIGLLYVPEHFQIEGNLGHFSVIQAVNDMHVLLVDPKPAEDDGTTIMAKEKFDSNIAALIAFRTRKID